MLRNSVAFIIALYAIGFAFAALAAVRWPTLLMLVAFFGDSASDLGAHVNWRELGLVYGLVYLVAAYFFFTTSSLISSHKAGSPVTYLLAVGIGFPPFVLFDFEAGWWQSPDLFEQIVLFGGVLSLFLLGSILELNRTRKRKSTKTAPVQTDLAHPVPPAAPIVLSAPVMAPQSPPSKPARRRNPPVSAAILRQRQSFAHHGRKMAARRSR